MTIVRGNEDDEIRRNPRSLPGKVRGGGGDLTGDAELQADDWVELIAEEEGRTESRIDDVGNAQDAILAGTGDLGRVHRLSKDEARRTKAANEDTNNLGASAPERRARTPEHEESDTASADEDMA